MALLTLSQVSRAGSPVPSSTHGSLRCLPAQASLMALSMSGTPLQMIADAAAAAHLADRDPAPLRPMDRAWITRWAAQLDEGRRLAQATLARTTAKR